MWEVILWGAFALVVLLYILFILFVESTIWAVIWYVALALTFLFFRYGANKYDLHVMLALGILWIIHMHAEFRRCDQCGKSGLRLTRPLKVRKEVGGLTREYTCKRCGYKQWGKWGKGDLSLF